MKEAGERKFRSTSKVLKMFNVKHEVFYISVSFESEVKVLKTAQETKKFAHVKNKSKWITSGGQDLNI